MLEGLETTYDALLKVLEHIPPGFGFPVSTIGLYGKLTF